MSHFRRNIDFFALPPHRPARLFVHFARSLFTFLFNDCQWMVLVVVVFLGCRFRFACIAARASHPRWPGDDLLLLPSSFGSMRRMRRARRAYTHHTLPVAMVFARPRSPCRRNDATRWQSSSLHFGIRRFFGPEKKYKYCVHNAIFAYVFNVYVYDIEYVQNTIQNIYISIWFLCV